MDRRTADEQDPAEDDDRINREHLLAALVEVFPVAAPPPYGASSERYYGFVEPGTIEELQPLVIARLTRTLLEYRKVADEHLKQFGHSMQRWQTLFDLAVNEPGETLTSISARVGIIGPRLVLLLDELEEEGLIVRLVDEKDRRSKLIKLTAAGEQVVTELYATMATVRSRVFQGLGRGQLALLLDAAEVMRRNLADLAEAMPPAGD